MASPVRYPTPLCFGDSSTCASNFVALVLSESPSPAPLRCGDSSLWDPIRDPQAHYIFSGALTPKIFKAFCKTILTAFTRNNLAAVS